MRTEFGVCAWNLWGDAIIDRPDNSDEIILSNIVKWLNTHTDVNVVYQFQKLTRDRSTEFLGENAQLRRWARKMLVDVHDVRIAYPRLDYLLVKWRWPVNGDHNDPRLQYQHDCLDHYLNEPDTQIFIWDDDFAMTQEEKVWFAAQPNVTLLEISESARQGDGLHTYIPYPMVLDRDLALSRVLGRSGKQCGDHVDDSMVLAYVGNNYKREEYLTKYIEPVADSHNAGVHFYGNWTKYDNTIRDRFPNIVFHPKVGRSMFQWIYQHCHLVPMLAKEEYFKLGHITPRMHEVVMSGGMPVGFSEFMNGDRYFSHLVNDAEELNNLVFQVIDCRDWDIEKRRAMLNEQLDILEDNSVFDVDEFFRCLGISKRDNTRE